MGKSSVVIRWGAMGACKARGAVIHTCEAPEDGLFLSPGALCSAQPGGGVEKPILPSPSGWQWAGIRTHSGRSVPSPLACPGSILISAATWPMPVGQPSTCNQSGEPRAGNY